MLSRTAKRVLKWKARLPAALWLSLAQLAQTCKVPHTLLVHYGVLRSAQALSSKQRNHAGSNPVRPGWNHR